jgi:hypothetical protein
MRAQRIFLVALAMSLLAHLVVVGNARLGWVTAQAEIPFPIQASLQMDRLQVVSPKEVTTAVERVIEAKAQAKQPAPVQNDAVTPTVSELPQPAGEPELLVESELFAPVEAAEAAEAVEVVERVQPEPSTESVLEVKAETAEVDEGAAAPKTEPMRALRHLPPRIALRYRVESGDNGFVIGQTHFSGEFDAGRYSLASITEATGITAFFIRGKIIQTSEGRVTEYGLQPTSFWSARGQRSQAPVRFDWAQSRLMLPSGGVELLPHTQDLMSFPFHLAMLMTDTVPEWLLPVTNGRKLREYVFHQIGQVSLVLDERQIETLHLRGERSGEGSLDVWLAPTHHWLPVRIRTYDQKGRVIVLTLQADTG